MATLDRANEAATTTVQSRPPRIPSGDNSVWADVSPLLHAACQDLHEGDLIHGDNFNLFAAMSALEIMDPKMDSGMASTYYSLDEAIENGAAPVPVSDDKTTDVRCIIDIFDHILACEATWHKGHSLAQTVYSCLYLLRPERTSSHALLHSFCQIIRATCKAVLSVVSDSRTHEVMYSNSSFFLSLFDRIFFLVSSHSFQLFSVWSNKYWFYFFLEKSTIYCIVSTH